MWSESSHASFEAVFGKSVAYTAVLKPKLILDTNVGETLLLKRVYGRFRVWMSNSHDDGVMGNMRSVPAMPIQ
jgi:hypothetical protein